LDENEILVSISMLTYNHEKYIRQALDSILMQKVNFKYEIVVGDDCSQDDTQNILNSYAQKFPDKFVLLLRDYNIGATNNSFDITRHCRGRYIANLEGDDFWIDENKLQIQVDFLETNKSCDAVAHRHQIVNDNGDFQYLSHAGIELDRYFTKEDALIYSTRLCHLNTLMYRNFFRGCIDDYTIMRDSNKYGSHSLMIYLLASRTDIYVMSRCMSAWRRVVSVQAHNFSSFAAKHPLLISKNNFLKYINYRNYFGGIYNFSGHIKDAFVDALFRIILSNEKGKLKEVGSLYGLLNPKEKIMVWFTFVYKLVKYTPVKLHSCFLKRINSKS